MRKLEPKEVSLNEIINLTLEQGESRYNISSKILKEKATNAGAVVRVGWKFLINRPLMDEYFFKQAE